MCLHVSCANLFQQPVTVRARPLRSALLSSACRPLSPPRMQLRMPHHKKPKVAVKGTRRCIGITENWMMDTGTKTVQSALRSSSALGTYLVIALRTMVGGEEEPPCTISWHE